MRYPFLVAAPLLGVLVLTAEPVSAQGMAFRGWGPRLGVQSNPDQGFVGAQFNFGEFAPRVRFQPNVELGFGDDHTILSTTVPAFYRFAKPASFTPYVGGGVTALLDRRDSPKNGDDTNVEFGLRIVGGIEWPLKRGNAFFLELTGGFGDIPEVQFLAGWNF